MEIQYICGSFFAFSRVFASLTILFIYDFEKLVELVLSDTPLMVMLNSYTTGRSASVMKYILDDIITNKRGGRVEADEIGVPVSSNARVLPCGSTAIWMLK